MPSSLPRPLSDLPIRRLTRDDLAACADLSEDRGWPRDEERWALLLAAGTGYGIDDPDSKGLMATCVVVSYGTGMAAVGMLLVAGRHTRRGIGRYLMQRVIEAAGETPLSLHATSAGCPLYEELGFLSVGRTLRLTGFFQAPAASGPLSDSGTTVRPASAHDLRALVELDSVVFGLDRTHLLTRLPTFADHMRVAERDGELIGYAALSPSAEHHALGPLVAVDTATAKLLLVSLAEATDRPLRADIDARHEDVVDWLGACGLRSHSETTVMVLGADRHGDWTRYFAPFSLATG
ncbi:GNAT family N-acetyltransferase [Streptomyces sp. OfavH-34-F]|uniref:GNAT family N-acetyltransferase n=1 Tax=Streptomyces sp. OfavH-34-F TaxID=2917760 RepID=UPI001EF256C5|nr:GNAT family N-acetyltransferase [Streptomyces sp. OfavH-34-F]MCG7523173.1 GNAT family N-acetyltransferase [Streptomyces sp. OfavH-34-F]